MSNFVCRKYESLSETKEWAELDCGCSNLTPFEKQLGLAANLRSISKLDVQARLLAVRHQGGDESYRRHASAHVPDLTTELQPNCNHQRVKGACPPALS